MAGALARRRSGPLADRRFRVALWLMLGTAGWAGIVLLAVQLFSQHPPKAAFDLELLLSAGRRVAAGLTPYGPLPSGPLQGEDLFYSYPPPVAQGLSLLAGVPSWVVFGLWGAGAAIGLAAVTRLLARQLGRAEEVAREAVVAMAAIAPYLFPFSVALLFGNLDAWFPLLFGLILLAVIQEGEARPALGPRIAGGVAVGLISVGKLHPASIVLWFLVRALRHDAHRLTLAVCVGTAVALFGASLLAGGLDPWLRYADLLRSASGADIVSRLNIGPASQVALVTGSESLVRPVEIVTILVALALTAWSAARVSDPVLSLALATVASLVTLPVTWYHYPVALVPFAAAAWLRRDRNESSRVGPILMAAGVLAVLAIAVPVAVWGAVLLVVYSLTIGPRPVTAR